MPVLDATREMTPNDALTTIRSRILADGLGLVVDLQASRGSYLYDANTGKRFLDFYAFYASQPITYGHPRMREPDFQAKLLIAATTKVANSDIYTKSYAEFVRTFDEVCGLPGFTHFFFIDGGALGIENALKAAFDWKVRKNLAAGRGEIGQQVLHFKQAFHGRTGYTLSLTNTADARKTMYFPKFNWPRVDNPYVNFALPPGEREADAARREAAALAQIRQAIAANPHDIAAIIIEPIQGEGGDNHFRGEFLQALREICDQEEILLIFDEVQCGAGASGRMWTCEHFDVLPDILCFGKKIQQCGLMATQRLDDVDNVFKVSSRINSTWGGNLVDMVRSTQYLRIVQEEGLVQRAAETGEHLQEALHRLAHRHAAVTAVRGRGLLCAFDLPDTATRDAFRKACFENQLLVLACGTRSIRFRPVLDISRDDIERGVEIMDEVLSRVSE